MTRVTAEQWNQTKKRTANAMMNQFFADAANGTKGITELVNQNNSNEKFKSLSNKKNEVNDLLARAQEVKNYYSAAGNKTMVDNVNNVTNFLKNINLTIDNTIPKIKTKSIEFGTGSENDALKMLSNNNTKKVFEENAKSYNRNMNEADYEKYGKENVQKWTRDVEGMSYKEKKKYIEDINTNTFQKQLKEEIKSYASGQEYINSLSETEKPSVKGFFDYLENNNKNFRHELRQRENKENMGHNNPEKTKQALFDLDKKSEEWENDSNDERAKKIEFLSKYAKDSLNGYEDYKELNDEYQQKIDNSNSVSESSKWQHEFSTKYGDTYLKTKQEYNFNSLSKEEQNEILEQTRLSDNEKQNWNDIGESDAKSGIRNNDKQHSGYLKNKKQELIQRGYSDSEADSILNYARQTVNREKSEEEYNEYYQMGQESGKIGPGAIGKIVGGIGSTLQSVPLSLASGLGAAETIWTKLKQGFGSETPIDYNSDGMRLAKNSVALREGAKSNYEELGQFIYDAFASTADSAATLPLNAIVPGATTIILGSSSATQSMIDGHEKGLSDAQAIGQGVAAGIFEGLFEKLSLDKIVKNTSGVKNIKDFLISNLKSIGIEGSEEGFTEIANILYDQLANGELSDYNLAVKDYKAQGFKEGEAQSKAREDLAKRVSQSVAGGMLGGAFMGVPMSSFNYANNKPYRDLTNKGQRLVDNGTYSEMLDYINRNMEKEDTLYQLIKETDKQDTAKIAYLANMAIENEYNKSTEAYADSVKLALTERLQELNVPEQQAKSMAQQLIENRMSGEENITNAGEYEKAYSQMENELNDYLNGKKAEFSNKIDRTKQEEHIKKAQDLEKLANGESLLSKEDRNKVDEIKDEIQQKIKTGKVSQTESSYLISDENIRFNITSLAVGTDGNTKVNTDTEQTYNIDDVAVDRDTAIIEEFAKDFTIEQRQNFFRSYNEMRNNINAVDFAMYYNQAYQYGKQNLGVESVMNNSILSTDALGRAYSSGYVEFQNDLKKKSKNIEKGNSKGSVKFDNISKEMLNDTQKAAVGVAEMLSDVIGVNYEFFESKKDEKGNYIGENGSYNRVTNTIRIDVNAGMKNSTEGNNIMLVTLAHELTHYIEEFSPQQYATLQEFAFNKLAQQRGQDIKELIYNEKDRIRERNIATKQTINEEQIETEAKSELVARSFEGMLTDAESIKELSKKDKGLFYKIKEKIISFAEKIEKACKELLQKDGRYKEGTVAKEALDLQNYAKEMRELWANALKDAGENTKIDEIEETKNIRFSMRQPMEETKDLIAVHNLSKTKLMEMLKLRGFPMPSIAITKATHGFGRFGEISVVFKKDTIDPTKSENKVYSGDAWTPVFPKTEWKLNDRGLKKLANTLNTSENYIEQYIENPETAVEQLKKQKETKRAFLEHKGIKIERKTTMPPYKTIALGSESIRNIIKERDIGIDEIVENEKLQRELSEIYAPVQENEPRIKQLKRNMFVAELQKGNARIRLEDDFDILYGKAKPIFDSEAFKKDTNEYLKYHDDEYTEYVERALDGVYEDKYLIRPNIEHFNSDGSSKSFNQLHLPYNLENIVRIMKQQNKGKGNGWFGGAKNLKGAATQKFENIEQIRESREKIQNMTEKEWDNLFEGLDDKISEIDNAIIGNDNTDIFARMSINDGINEIMVKAFAINNFNEKSVKKLFEMNDIKISDKVYKMMKSLRDELMDIPVQYFEAKPERAVGLEEIAYIVIPDNASEGLKNVLNENDITYIEYQAGDEEDRKNALNSEPDILFQSRSYSYDNLSYQERNGELSNREILATALKTTAINESERAMITDYQKNIEQLNDLDKKLDIVNGALKDLYFMAGKKNVDTIKSLQEQAEGIKQKMRWYDGKLLKMESTAALKNLLEREKMAAAKKQRIADTEKLKLYRIAQNEKFERMQRRYQRAAKQKVENRKRLEARNKIIKRVDKLNKMLEQPNNKKHIPKDFMRATTELLKNLNQDGMNIAERIDEMRERMAGYTVVPTSLVEQYTKLLEKKDTLEKRTDELSKMYAKIENDPDYSGNYSETVMEQINRMKEIVGNKAIGAMDVKELNVVKETIDLLTNEISSWNEILDTKFIDGKGNEMNIKDVSYKAYDELLNRAVLKDNVFHKFENMQLSANRMFKRIGGYVKNGAWEQIGNMLNEGQRDKLKFEQGAASIFDSVLSNKADKENQSNIKKMQDYKKNKVDIGLIDEEGRKVKITRAMMLSVYMHLLNEENTRHAMYGGFSVPEMSKYYKGDRGAAFAQNKQRAMGVSVELAQLGVQIQKAVERGASEKEIIEMEKGHEEIIERGKIQMAKIKNNIEKLMNDYDRRVIKSATEYFDKYSRNAINEVTMKRYGMKKAGVDNYFPIHTDSNYLSTEKSTKGDMAVNLENSGFIQDRVKSTKPIYLEDIFNVINDSISKTGTYVGFLIPQYNYNRILGYTSEGYKKNISNMLDKKFGIQAKKYLNRLEKDLFGGKTNESSFFWKKMRGNVAQGSLTLNLSVTAGQAASYFTAAPVVGYNNLAKALLKGGKKERVISAAERELINKYTPLLWYRNIGNASQEISDMKNGNGWYNTINDKTNGYLFGWIQKADVATVGRLWYASQYYVEEKFKKIEKGTEEYYKEVSKVFNQVVEETQPNYTTMQRPHVLRSNNEMVKMFTMFSTQRIQNYNILFDSIATAKQYKRDFNYKKNGVTIDDVKRANRIARNAVTSQLVSAAVLGVMKTAAALLLLQWRDMGDDEEKISKEGILKATLSQFGSNLAGIVVGGTDLYDLIFSIIGEKEYYGLSLTGYDTVVDFIEEIQDYSSKFLKGKIEGDDNIRLIKKFSSYMGIPYASGKKLWDGIKGWTSYSIDRIKKENVSLIDYASTSEINTSALVEKSVSGEKLDKKLFDKLVSQEREKVQTLHPDWNNNLTNKETEKRVRNKYTKTLKESYQSGKTSKEVTIKKMKSTGLYLDDKGREASEKTIANWDIAKLREQYKNAETFEDKKEIRKKLWDTKHWKRLKDLDKQLKSWRGE